MESWEKHLAHERAIRDCHVAAGHIPKPDKPDPEGGMVVYRNQLRKFNGKLFWTAMDACGHTSAEFASCQCSRN